MSKLGTDNSLKKKKTSRKIIKIPKSDIGLLSNYGYKLKHSYEERIKSIKKALKEEITF